MLDAVYEWIKNIAFYLVIMTAVMEVLPGDTYKKYIRFFTGLVLILLVMTPVLKLTGSFNMFQEKYRKKEQELQTEIEAQKEIFKEADVFGFLSETFPEAEIKRENYVKEEGTKRDNEITESLTEKERNSNSKIKVEEIRIGEVQGTSMESDTYRE